MEHGRVHMKRNYCTVKKGSERLGRVCNKKVLHMTHSTFFLYHFTDSLMLQMHFVSSNGGLNNIKKSSPFAGLCAQDLDLFLDRTTFFNVLFFRLLIVEFQVLCEFICIYFFVSWKQNGERLWLQCIFYIYISIWVTTEQFS